jgi:hypothetical protein
VLFILSYYHSIVIFALLYLFQPSSSGRSAELLGTSAPTFVGFTAVKDGGFVPVLPGFSVPSEQFDPNLNSDFHLVLKKMGKKDSTTKLKVFLMHFQQYVRKLF